MNTGRFGALFSIGLLIALLVLGITSVVLPQPAYATCGTLAPCPPAGPGERQKKPTATATIVRAIPTTPVPTSVPSATATTDAAVVLPGAGGQTGGSTGELVPAVSNPQPAPGGMAFLFGLPGGLLGPIGLLLLLGIVIGVGSGRFRTGKGSPVTDGSDKMGAQPHMSDGSIGNPDFNPGTALGFNPQPDPPGKVGHDLNPGSAFEFNPQPDPPGSQAMPGSGAGGPSELGS